MVTASWAGKQSSQFVTRMIEQETRFIMRRCNAPTTGRNSERPLCRKNGWASHLTTGKGPCYETSTADGININFFAHYALHPRMES